MKPLIFNETEKISYCISTELRDVQIKINCRKIAGRIGDPEQGTRQDKIAIVCYGPSLKETWEQLKDFKYIITCSGAHKFLIEKGIIPTWHVDLDPREHKITMLGQPHKDVEYLIASTVHPKYFDQLKGYNVKLWHIYATDDNGSRILPEGEWVLTGGSSVGLRCMTIARYFGFVNQHIFGMDGNVRKDGSHSDLHPNAPKENQVQETTLPNGKIFTTTPSMLYCAKETFKELNQMPDIKATFYGDGLVQELAKDYVPAIKKGVMLAINRPELISKEKIELEKELHDNNPGYGMGGAKHISDVLAIFNDERNQPKLKSILDYGCGKGMLGLALAKEDISIFEYDPGIPGKDSSPRPADLVVCTDVLEHIEPDKIEYVLNDLKRCVKRIGYFIISTRKAVKTYSNGKNTHSLVKTKTWWHNKLAKYFTVGQIVERAATSDLQVIVAPWVEVEPEFLEVARNGVKVKFLIPNEATKWRAQTLFTKEPSTVEWIEAMTKGEIFFDVGANIGSYSILAGAHGLKVYAFEPEAENYALLVKNMLLNNIEPNAYCVAISNEEKAGLLHTSKKEAGLACHSFNEEIGPDLQPRKAGALQGCLGLPLDSFIARGLPSPHHLKIDVDGLEHLVIKSAEHILMNGLKSLLVEVNQNLPEHLAMIDYLKSIGFEYDQAQVDKAVRQDGPFKGCAEYVFTKRKESPVTKDIVKKIKHAELKEEPFKYLHVENIFMETVYEKLLERVPKGWLEIEKTRNLKGYPERFTGTLENDFLKTLGEQLLTGAIKNAILEKFGIADEQFSQDLLFIKDLPGYKIPPHTDATSKIISALFYLTKDCSFEMQQEGTRLYTPKQEGFTCSSGRHHNFEDFNLHTLVPFKANSVLIFARTDNSFHGVEPTNHERTVLLYNIKKSNNGKLSRIADN